MAITRGNEFQIIPLLILLYHYNKPQSRYICINQGFFLFI